MMARFSVIQMTSVPSVEENINIIETQLNTIDIQPNHCVVLPECCFFFGGKEVDQLTLAKENIQTNFIEKSIASLARKYQVTIAAGSLPIYNEETGKFTNSCCVYSCEGLKLSQYNKIHLFDVSVNDDENSYSESRYTHAGNQTNLVTVNGINIGLTICYDLRFPELFRQLRVQGADVIIVPSAFTKVTGKAHWEVLLRARAIENQVYIVAAGQTGLHPNGRETWGHSMIISPWGEILSSLEVETGHTSADICLSEISKIRRAMPVAEHNRFITKLK